MPTFRITFTAESGRAPEDVEADTMHVEASNGMLLLRSTVLVAGQPQEIVVRRVHGVSLESVEELP